MSRNLTKKNRSREEKLSKILRSPESLEKFVDMKRRFKKFVDIQISNKEKS